MAEQQHSQQFVPSNAGLAVTEDTERGMLCLDDELAGLLEAADMPADQHAAHATKPEPASSMPGAVSVALGMSFSCTTGLKNGFSLRFWSCQMHRGSMAAASSGCCQGSVVVIPWHSCLAQVVLASV